MSQSHSCVAAPCFAQQNSHPIRASYKCAFWRTSVSSSWILMAENKSPYISMQKTGGPIKIISFWICTAASWKHKLNPGPIKKLLEFCHDNWTVFHFPVWNSGTFTALLASYLWRIASFSSREFEWKATKWKKKRRTVCTAAFLCHTDTTQQHAPYKRLKMCLLKMNISSPNTLRNSWLSVLPALLLERQVYGPPSPWRMFLTVSVLLPPSIVFKTYCSDRSITWPFLKGRKTQLMRWLTVAEALCLIKSFVLY